MIKFFRKIRYTLMEQNKTAKYLKYAIGEIILVMIGILFALQVNNWNQQRIANQKEELLLQGLHNEFLKNKIQLEKIVLKHEQSLAAAEFAIAQFPLSSKTNMEAYRAGTKGWGMWATFSPSQGVIRSLVNTSSFELISNLELRALLISWEDVLEDFKEEEDQARYVLQNFLFTEIAKHISWSGLVPVNKLYTNYLSTLQYENVFYRRRTNLKNIIDYDNKDNELRIIQKTIDKIIQLSKPKK